MTNAEVVFWRKEDGGREKPPTLPYACTAIVDGVARSLRILGDGPPTVGKPFLAKFEFIFGFQADIQDGSNLLIYEGYRAVGCIVVKNDTQA